MFGNITKEEKEQIKTVMDRFKQEKTEEEIFYHFCFTLLVPQTTHKSTMVVVSNLKKKNLFQTEISEEELKNIVKPCRFYNNKTRYILSLKENWDWIYKMLMALKRPNIVREFLVNEVSGLGMKAASHLMRNLGFDDVAIIDTHILKHYKSDAPKNINSYIELEDLIRKDAERFNLSVGELDIYLWKIYSKTDWKDFIF